ncbi:DUF1302 domain-containing protein [Glaciimonas soli]|uniref:DUF1302 family protein n=1 Tax=Glaciimonas soli TaxID=2590999 RepID=A0A843YZH9_9BURK|nr:DUF1302 family protein [Glaciimonas soli]MQR01946.1 DUF1302 family protein [Glaciimonas soli]
MRWKSACILAGISALAVGKASALDFDNGTIQGNVISNVTAGLGMRTKDPSCSLIGVPDAYGCGANVNTDEWANGDNGNMNYKQNQLFTGYLSLTSELLLKMPSEGLKFLARGTAFADPMAQRTQTTPLAGDARAQMDYRGKILDLWLQKDLTIDDQAAHFRLGNQVINWGESIFAIGGINATNAVDVQTLLTPGTQLKQALLPAPMLSFASSLPAGFSTEAYYQFQWMGNTYPAVGSYWSMSNNYGRGAIPFYSNPNNFNVGGLPDPSTAYPYTNKLPGNKPQYGLKFAYSPPGAEVNFGAYYESYTDKSPVMSSIDGGLAGQYSYQKNRDMFGLSMNFPLGLWAIASEFSYRPRDAVSMSSCYLAGGPPDLNTNAAAGNCNQFMDNKRYQFTLNALLAMTPSSHPMVKWLGADQALFTAEVSMIDYPGIDSNKQYTSTIDGQAVYQLPAAGSNAWLNYNSGLGYPIGAGQGTARSAGYTLDFNWTYDGTVLPGWGVTPGVTFSNAFSGYTPNFTANYARGAKSANFYVLLVQNPATWQAGINFTVFYGGNSSYAQPYADRNFLGMYATRNF